MSDTHLANDASARDATGTIVDKTAPLESQTNPETEPKVEPKTEPAVDAKVEPKVDDKTGDKKADATVVPEKYEFKVPDGVKLDEAATTAASAIFKDLGLSQESAQKLIDFHTAQLKSAGEAPFNLMNEQRAEWRKEIAADKDIGGKLESEVKPAVSKAIDSLGPEIAKGFRQAMDTTGVGDHPGFIRAFYKIAQQLNEGGHVKGSGPAALGQKAPGAKPPSAANALYPNLA